MSINRHEWLKAVNKDSKLPHRAVRVALALWTRGNETDDHVYPGMDDIMEQSGLSRDTAKRGLLDLVGAGWLHRTEGRGRTNFTVYTFCSPGKVIAISSGKRGANMPQEKGGSSALSGKKRVQLCKKKGAVLHFPIIRLNNPMNKRARASISLRIICSSAMPRRG